VNREKSRFYARRWAGPDARRGGATGSFSVRSVVVRNTTLPSTRRDKAEEQISSITLFRCHDNR